MPSLVDLTYYSNSDKKPDEIVADQQPALAFSEYLQTTIEFIKHSRRRDTYKNKNIQFTFFKRRNNFWSIPFHTHKYIRQIDADVILVQGFIFPLQLIILRLTLPSKVKILVQHHGEQPFSGLKYFFQKLSGKCMDACLFTAKENSVPWINKGIISKNCKCFEIMEASTDFQFKNQKEALKKKLGMTGNSNYLWVGRLNQNKDPLTVVHAFYKYKKLNSEARLYMIFHDNELLNEIASFLTSANLQDIIFMVGKIPHDKLETWYNAADFYISASLLESTGYALLESMACGCIPIVTNIPSFRKITLNGTYGFLYKPGDINELLQVFIESNKTDRTIAAALISNYFIEKLSFRAIAKDLDAVCQLMLDK
jgi:glycosyltransferase involved in cell wall biosynthesis